MIFDPFSNDIHAILFCSGVLFANFLLILKV